MSEEFNSMEAVLPPFGDRRYHFADEQVLASVGGTDYMAQKIQHRLNHMTSGEKFTLYRALASLIKGDPSDPENVWISVKDHLPYGRDHLLLVSSDGIDRMVVGYWNRLTKCWMVDCKQDHDLEVTHWRTLPAGPTEKPEMSS